MKHSLCYDLIVPLTRENWHGRMNALSGIGASSHSEDKIVAFEEEHNELSPQQDCGVSPRGEPFDFSPQRGAESNRKFIEYLMSVLETFDILHFVTVLNLRSRQ